LGFNLRFSFFCAWFLPRPSHRGTRLLATQRNNVVLQAAQRWRRSGGARGQIDASAGAASEPRGVNSVRLALQLGQKKPESDLLGNGYGSIPIRYHF